MNERRNYSKAFKLEAVRLLELGEIPAAQLARELDIRRNLLYKWRDQFVSKGEHAFAGAGRRARPAAGSGAAPETVAQENARLKRELAALREERDILKKAAAYFAAELK
jgi:transposase